MPTRPPPELVSALVDGPSVLSGLEWHDAVASTNLLAAEAAARGAPEVYAVLADLQTAGRGRRGRAWAAPPGTSLLQSLLVRPPHRGSALGLLPLLTGLALAEAVGRCCAAPEAALKWPNDVLLDGRKTAGILVEALPGGACVLGVGINVDWRGVARPESLATTATSLAEAGCAVDRWELFAAFVGALGDRYREWCRDPAAFLPAYRARSATLGRRVRVRLGDGRDLEGVGESVADDGALEIRGPDGLTRLVAGDVEHLRQAGST